jgi:hypothetical protein
MVHTKYTWRITDGLSEWYNGHQEEDEKDDPKWEKKVERVMKQNLTSDNTITKELWQMKTSDWWSTGKLTDRWNSERGIL